MSETQAGFLDSTPIVAGEAYDIVWLGDSLFTAVEYADRFWTTHAANPHIEAAMRGVIHSYSISRTPTSLEFEEFIYLYTALEGCHCVYT